MYLIQLKTYRPSSKIWTCEKLQDIISCKDFIDELSYRVNDATYAQVINELKSIGDNNIRDFNDRWWDALEQDYCSSEGECSNVVGGLVIFPLSVELVNNNPIYIGDDVGL